MNRREAIRWVGLASLAVILDFNPSGNIVRFPAAVESQGILYRGTPDGDIHVSRDGGQTWKLHNRFGPQVAIIGMSKDWSGRVIAHMDYQGWTMQLVLAKNSRFWTTL